MSVQCALFVDDEPSPEVCYFAAIPRVGEMILVQSDDFERIVENVKHIAQGPIAKRRAPYVQIHCENASESIRGVPKGRTAPPRLCGGSS